VNVGIASIMHSGTHLMVNMLQPLMKGCSIDDARVGKPGYFVYHLVDEQRNDFKVNFPLITPMRHPVRVYESWRVRGKEIQELEKQYKNLVKITPLFIHIDRADRDEWVSRAGKALGLPLSTTWPLMSPKNTLGFKVTPARISAIPEWVMDIYDKTLEA